MAGIYDRKKATQGIAAGQKALEQRIASVTPPVISNVKTGNPLTRNNNALSSIRKNGK